MLCKYTVKIFQEGGTDMWGKTGAVAVIALVVCAIALPARAIVIEDVVTQHPLIALVHNWSVSAQETPVSTSPGVSEPSSLLLPNTHNLPAQSDVTVSPDNITVEIVPIRLPDLPTYAVFVIYLVGAMVFYTLLVLVAQPGPAEYY